jgi:hypothetical protein
VYLAADLLDNVMDDELPERWQKLGHGQATLAAAAMLAALPDRALDDAERGIPAARIARLRRSLTGTLLTMGVS